MWLNLNVNLLLIKWLQMINLNLNILCCSCCNNVTVSRLTLFRVILYLLKIISSLVKIQRFQSQCFLLINLCSSAVRGWKFLLPFLTSPLGINLSIPSNKVDLNFSHISSTLETLTFNTLSQSTSTKSQNLTCSQDNSPTNQLVVSQVADWITRGLVNSPTANF